MDAALAEEDTIGGGFGVEPTGEVEGGFDEKEFSVGVVNTDGEVGECAGDLEQEE